MRWTYISTLQTKTSLGACRKCLCCLPGLSGSPATSSTPTDQPQRKLAGQIYSASGAVRSAVADQQIGDDAVTWHQRLVGRSRASTVAPDHLDSCTSWRWACIWLAPVHRANAAQCEEPATSLARTSSCRWPLCVCIALCIIVAHNMHKTDLIIFPLTEILYNFVPYVTDCLQLGYNS